MGALEFPVNFPEIGKKEDKTDSAAFPGSLCHSHCATAASECWPQRAGRGQTLPGRFWSLAPFLGACGRVTFAHRS